MQQVTSEEVAWAAGLFEGEGCISVYQREYGAKIQPQIRLGMTDADVVARFARIVGCGSVTVSHGPKHQANGWKPLHQWVVYEAEKVRTVLNLLMPYLGERRSAKAREVLDRCVSVQSHNAKKTHCPRGHELAGVNLVEEPFTARNGHVYIARRCKTCRADQARARKARAA
jgi:hypothetical protein